MVATIIYFYNQVDYKIIKSVFVFGSGKQPAAASRLPYSVPVSYSERPRDHAVLDASAFPATHARVVPAQNLKSDHYIISSPSCDEHSVGIS